MALNKDFIFMVIEAISGKKSTYSTSLQPQKKFSDVAKYIREGKFLGHSSAGRPRTDSDNGMIFNYEYYCNGKDQAAGYYKISIRHMGDSIINMDVENYACGAAYAIKESIKKMEAKLETVTAKVVEIPKVDYSGKELPELLDIFDKKLLAFSSNPSAETFCELVPVKEAAEAKINSIPLAQRGAYSQPMTKLNTYFSTIKSQLENPMLDVKQFAGTYVSQMQAALAEIAQVAG